MLFCFCASRVNTLPYCLFPPLSLNTCERTFCVSMCKAEMWTRWPSTQICAGDHITSFCTSQHQGGVKQKAWIPTSESGLRGRNSVVSRAWQQIQGASPSPSLPIHLELRCTYPYQQCKHGITSIGRKCWWGSGEGILEGGNYSERKKGSPGGKRNGTRKGEARGWEAGLEGHGKGMARSKGTSF